MKTKYPKLYLVLYHFKRNISRIKKENDFFDKMSYFEYIRFFIQKEVPTDIINSIIFYVFDDIINFICENLRDDLEDNNIHFTTDIKEFFLSEITRSRFRTNNAVSLSMIIGKLDGQLKLRLLYDPINILLTWSRTQLGYDFYNKLNQKISLKLERLYYNII